MNKRNETGKDPFSRFEEIWDETVEPEIKESSLPRGAHIALLRMYADSLRKIQKTCQQTIGVRCFIDQLDPQGEQREYLDEPELRVISAVDKALIELVKNQKLTAQRVVTVYAAHLDMKTKEIAHELDLDEFESLQ